MFELVNSEPWLVAILVMWLAAALIVYSVIVFPLLLWLRNGLARRALLVLLAGLLGPGLVGGHGLAPVPSAVGLWMNLGQDPAIARWHAVLWLTTAVGLLLWDWLLLWLLGERRARITGVQSRILLGPAAWPLWQWLGTLLLVVLMSEFVDSPNRWIDALLLALVAAVLLVSTYLLGALHHLHAKDYKISIGVLALALALVCLLMPGEVWERCILSVACLLGGAVLMGVYQFALMRAPAAPAQNRRSQRVGRAQQDRSATRSLHTAPDQAGKSGLAKL